MHIRSVTLASVRDFNRDIARSRTKEAVVQALADHCATHFDLPTAWLYMLENEGDSELRLLAAAGPHAQHVTENLPGVLVEGDPMVEQLASGAGPIYVQREQIQRNNPEVVEQMDNVALIVTQVLTLDAHRGVIGAGAFKDDEARTLDTADIEHFDLVGTMVSARLAELFKLEQAERQAKDAARAAGRERTASLRVMAQGLMHDFGNMVGAIQSCVDLLEYSELSPEQRADLATVREAARRATQLATQLSVLGHGAELNPQPTDASAIIRRAIRLVRPIHRQEVALTIAPAGDPPTVLADEASIVQVLVNLLKNAFEAGGGVSVSVETVPTIKEAHPAAPEDSRGPYCKIVVADHGAGIPESALEHIFEPYFSTKAEKGSGLGLAVSLASVAAQGGHITCTSRLGHGSAFAIYLPPG